MASIENIVDVQISKDTATVSRVGFGTPLILAYHTGFAGLAVRYGSIQEITDAGFATTSRVYKMASAIFAQNPKPPAVIVGRRATAPTRNIKLTPKASPLASTAYDITINGETMSYTSDATPTVAEITLGIETAVNAGAQPVTATDNSTDVDIVADAAGAPFEIVFDPALWTFNDNTADPGIAADLAAIRLENDDWYAICCDALGALEIDALATAVESLAKIYIADTQDSDVIEAGGGIAATLAAASLDRTALMYHPDTDPSPAAAWIGKQLPTDPGSTTWAFKTLATIANYSLTDGEQAFAEANDANHYQDVAGINITLQGTMAGGEFVDITRGIDWLTSRLREDVFRVLAVNGKVPFTNLGIQLIVNEVEGRLRDAAGRGLIDGTEEIIVEAPLASEVDANTKASRTLPDVTFQATLAGAIHKVQIRGRVTV